MDAALLPAYRATDYRVRLPRGGWATIRINASLPAALHALIDVWPWAFVTAWNPRSRLVPRDANRRAQRELLAALRALPETAAILPACGVGPDGWREPSLFVIGPDTDRLDALMHQHGQNAYVHGHGRDVAMLRLP